MTHNLLEYIFLCHNNLLFSNLRAKVHILRESEERKAKNNGQSGNN